MNPRRAWIVAALLLTVMAALMIGASREDSATVDETTHLSAGYSFWKGYRYRMCGDHPPLGELWEAVPLLFMDVKMPYIVVAMLQGRLSYTWIGTWRLEVQSIRSFVPEGCQAQGVQLPPPARGEQMVLWNCPSAYPIDNWYYWIFGECQMVGKYLVYGGQNDGDALLFAGRMAQTLLILLTGVLIFCWARRAASSDVAGLLALALWVFNPTPIAYGRLTNTDAGVTLGMTLTLYLWARFLKAPSRQSALWVGLATGMTLVMKYTAIILAPIFFVTLVWQWKRLNQPIRSLLPMAGIFFAATWAILLIVYFPNWSPPPPISDVQAAILQVPDWFRTFRPILIPATFFKGLGLALGHSKGGHDSYLMGEWSRTGWWYYFPAVFFLKSPIAFVIAVVGGLAVFLRRLKSVPPLEGLPWLAAGLYLLPAMTSGVNIGIRHLLPIFPLLCIGSGCALAMLMNRNKLKIATLMLLGWQAVTTLIAYPLYIQFFSEVVGGSKNGYKYLLDSNYDWGQDAKRLKSFLDDRKIDHIYLDYYGTQFSIEHLGIPNTRVDAEVAKQIRQGTLVVSASELMKPAWTWLRESRQPVARVAHTLFVYQFP